MIITLTYKNSIAVIEAAADTNYINKIVEEAKWIMTHISSDNPSVLLHDLRVAIPTLTALDVMSIQNIMSASIKWERKFTEICNTLAKGEIFRPIEHIDFQMT